MTIVTNQPDTAPIVTVWRLEDKKGHGPFEDMPARPHTIAKHVAWMKIDMITDGLEAALFGPQEAIDARDPEHPHHMHDGLAHLPDNGDQWKIATKDREQFLHWFPETSLPWFAKHGFHPQCYKVPPASVRFGKWQLAFDADKAVKTDCKL